MQSRRELLKKAATCSAAPLLWQLAGRTLAAAETPAKPSVIFYFIPEGTIPNNFFPAAGPITSLPVMSSPLTPWISRLTMVDGLSMYSRDYIEHYSQAYTLAAGAPTSIDNIIAQELMADMPIPNLRVSVINYWAEQAGNSRIDNVGYIGEDNPLKLYGRLFGQGPLADDASIYAVRKIIGADVAAQVVTSLDALDQIKQNMARLPVPPINLRGLFDLNTNFSKLNYLTAEQLATLVDIQQDISVMALALNITRCVSFNIGHQIWPISVINGFGAMDAAHQGGTPLNEQVRWLMSTYARLMAKLAAISRPQGSLLDTTFCLSYSNMGIAQLDNQDRMPFVLAGGQAWGHQGGRTLDYRIKNPAFYLPAHTQLGLPHAQLYTAIAQKMGSSITEFGNTEWFNGLGGKALPGLWG